MTNPESLDRHQTGAAQQALADAKSAEAIALRLEDAYIRYIVLANTGGMAACLSLANGLLGEKTLPADVVISCWFDLRCIDRVVASRAGNTHGREARSRCNKNSSRSWTDRANTSDRLFGDRT